MPRPLVACALLLSVLPCAVAFADGPSLAAASPPADRAALPGTAELQLGVGSAVGFLGAAISYRLVGPLELEGGLGYGHTGLQLSLMPKLKFGSVHDRFVFGAGLSYAVPGAESDTVQGATTPLLWVNVDALGYEHRAPSGFVFSISAGTTTCLTDAESPGFLYSAPVQWHLYTTAQARVGIGFGF